MYFIYNFILAVLCFGVLTLGEIYCPKCAGDACYAMELEYLKCNPENNTLPYNFEIFFTDTSQLLSVCTHLEYNENGKNTPVKQCLLVEHVHELCEEISDALPPSVTLTNCTLDLKGQSASMIEHDEEKLLVPLDHIDNEFELDLGSTTTTTSTASTPTTTKGTPPITTTRTTPSPTTVVPEEPRLTTGGIVAVSAAVIVPAGFVVGYVIFAFKPF